MTNPENSQSIPAQTETLSAEAHQPVSAPDARPEPLRPRAGTIVWGCMLLVIATIAILAAQLDFGELGPAVPVWAIVGFGALLVVAGLIIAIVKAVTRSGTRDNGGA